MRRVVRLHPTANEDLVHFVRSIGRSVSRTAAVRWRKQIEEVIRTLEVNAEQWPMADEAIDLQKNLRFRIFGRRRHVYRILFTIHRDTVTVQRVRHAAQDTLTTDDL